MNLVVCTEDLKLLKCSVHRATQENDGLIFPVAVKGICDVLNKRPLLIPEALKLMKASIKDVSVSTALFGIVAEFRWSGHRPSDTATSTR